jgi:hypothetical protein
VEVQTDTELLQYIASIEKELKNAREEIAMLEQDIEEVKHDRARYRYLWMSQCRYTANLEDADSESSGGMIESQVPEWENSSPYYHRMFLPLFFIFDLITQRRLPSVTFRRV